LRWTSLTILGMLVAPVAVPAAADVLIVRAIGPSASKFAPGKSLPDSAHIALAANDQVVLLDAHGTRTLRGPGRFAATGQSGAATSIGLLASAGTDRRSRIGAVRGLPVLSGPQQRPNIWFVDTGASGATCLADPTVATLWRSSIDKGGDATIVTDGGANAKLSWIKGQSTQPWPASVPIRNGASYRIGGVDAATAATTITLHVLKAPPGDMQGLAQALIGENCQAQLDVLIATDSNGG
jgi:hypothetical protein